MAEGKMMHSFMFEDSFKVKTVDTSRFERAGRIAAESVSLDNEMQLDVNTILYPMAPGELIHVGITDNVSPADNPRRLSTAYDHDRRLLGKSIMDEYDYVMYGKVYKKDDDKQKNAALVFASYGGLLMRLGSDSKQLQDFHVGDAIYLLMKKVDKDG
eukprot:TRINITY_DN91818_c0_g1_i1.p1 TRINITY_DN91818_c0_g1~~TRINITY_DN91818_c0_g1_i1.p1  ORF type:complete len:157 (+),score=40.53 TRINITY_DN91818_c0_g1_i1:163-633(+)